MATDRTTRRRQASPLAVGAGVVAMAAATVAVLWIAYLARWGLLLVYLGALIAVGISPLAGWMERQSVPWTDTHPPRWFAALVVYAAVGALLVAVGLAVVPPLTDQAQELVQRGPALFEAAEQFLVHHGVIAHPMSVRDLVLQIPVDLRATVVQQFWNVIGGVFGLLLILVLSLYLLHDAQRLRAVLLSLVPRSRQRQVRLAVEQIGSRIGAWMMGQLMLSAIIGASTALALGLLGLPYFYVLAVLAAVGELVPYAGPLLAAAPGILLAATVSWQTALAVAGFYVAQQQLENHVLVPNLMQHQVGLTPSVIMIAVTVGWAVLGVLGALIAVPTAAILQVGLSTLRPDDRIGAW